MCKKQLNYWNNWNKFTVLLTTYCYFIYYYLLLYVLLTWKIFRWNTIKIEKKFVSLNNTLLKWKYSILLNCNIIQSFPTWIKNISCCSWNIRALLITKSSQSSTFEGISFRVLGIVHRFRLLMMILSPVCSETCFVEHSTVWIQYILNRVGCWNNGPSIQQHFI